MNDKSLFNCIDAFTSAFCTVEKGEGYIRFSDEKITDMYDHNYILIQPEMDIPACERIIFEEIERRKTQGRTFCQVELSSGRQKEALTQMKFPIKPEISNYVNCITTAPEDLKLAGGADCLVRRIETQAMAQDRTSIEIEAYGSGFGEDFCKRKGIRNSEVYMAQEGVDSYVCYVDKNPVGKADFLVHEGWAMIEDLDVLPAMQRKGFGTAILRVLTDEAVARGADGIFLVADSDDTAKDMYSKLGFIEKPGRTSLFFEWS